MTGDGYGVFVHPTGRSLPNGWIRAYASRKGWKFPSSELAMRQPWGYRSQIDPSRAGPQPRKPSSGGSLASLRGIHHSIGCDQSPSTWGCCRGGDLPSSFGGPSALIQGGEPIPAQKRLTRSPKNNNAMSQLKPKIGSEVFRGSSHPRAHVHLGTPRMAQLLLGR